MLKFAKIVERITHAEQRSTLFRDLNVTERTVPVTEYYRKRAIPYRS